VYYIAINGGRGLVAMADIFFSYSHHDLERVRPFVEAFETQGFKVFWDQTVPPGKGWDTWIREKLTESTCLVVFWTENSVKSRNVHHEATIALDDNKLIPVLLDPLKTAQFPMGLHGVQGADMTSWNGDWHDAEWQKLKREVEGRIAPRWVGIKTDALETALARELKSREALEARYNALRNQMALDKHAKENLNRERDREHDRAEILKSRLDATASEQRKLQSQLQVLEDQNDALAAGVEEAMKARETLEQTIAELKATRDAAVAEVSDLKQRLARAEAQIADQSRHLAETQTKVDQLAKVDPTVRRSLARNPMSTPAFLIRLIWVLSGGLLMAIFWVFAGTIMGLTLIGLPWMQAAFRIAAYVLFPFSHEAVSADLYPGKINIGSGPLAFLRNLVWFLFAGWWLILLHLVIAGVLAVSVVGIPFAWVHLKILWIALWPIGKVVVPVERASFPFALPDRVARSK
jgi:uncharacterized membrane protein YccF (DUF307 family)/predicted  nucleic acid-binding Zn-ribbon protein